MQDTIIRISLVLTVALGAAVADGQNSSGKSGLDYPLVPGHGGVVALPQAAEQPRKNAKAIFDITADTKPGVWNKGLEQVARLLNLYGVAGMKAGDVKIVAVLHGEADKAALSDRGLRRSLQGRGQREPAPDSRVKESPGGSVCLRSVLARTGV